MNLLKKIVLGVVCISLLTFVALFGQLPALRKTPVGWLQRALCLHLPNALHFLDRRITGGRVTARSKRLGQYLFFEKNPVVLIIFLALLSACAGPFVWYGLPHLPLRLQLPIPVLLALPYVFTYLCVTSTAHYITPSNHAARLRDYPYDYILFRPGNNCPTCSFAKPARSKHCSLCGFCVSKCDHHCPWVNNCVGRGNYAYFMSLLFTLFLLESYGTYLAWNILRPDLPSDLIATLSLTNLFTQAFWSDLARLLTIAIDVGGLSVTGVGLIAAMTAGLPLGLFAYHLYLIWAGMTTNESQKWTEWREDMADGYVFKASRRALRAHNRLRSQSEQGDLRRGRYEYGTAAASPAMNPVMDYGLDGWDAIDDEIAWPLSSDQILVRTTDGALPYEQEALWERIWSLKNVQNVYDLGGWKNFVELLRGR